MKLLSRRYVLIAAAAPVLLIGVVAAGCVHRSGGEWMFSSAPLPEGWPSITPVGEVEVKEYPLYRAASVEGVQLDRQGMGPMFMELFRHIKRNDIAMTAPVDMGYATTDDGQTRLASMAFLYRTPELGETGVDGTVRVEDLRPAMFVTTGVRGGYSTSNYKRGLVRLDEWLRSNPGWQAAGEPRFLGYNSPFVPVFLRYGEVQIPVAERAVE